MKKIFLSLVCIFLVFSCKVEEASTNIIYVDRAPTENCYGYKKITNSDSVKSEINIEHMIYVINEEIDLNGETVIVGKNSILQFDKAGCLKNGNVIFENTYLDGSVNFENCSFSGKLINKTVTFSWFGPIKDLSVELKDKKNSKLIEQVIACAGEIIVIDDFYPIGEQISISKRITLKGSDWDESWYSKTWEYTKEATKGFYTVGDISAFNIEASGSINLYGIYVKGHPEKYTGTNNVVPNELTWAFILPNHGSLSAIYNCKIEGFTQGIRGIGGFLEKIQNTTFDSCRHAIFTVYTSDYDIYGCKFLNCLGNYKVNLVDNPNDKDMNDLRHIGCAIYVELNGMVNYNANYFENNFIDYIFDESDIILNVQDSTFVNPSMCNFYFYNDYHNISATPFIQLSSSELHKITIDNIVISGNSFIQNAGCTSKCISCFRETNVVTRTVNNVGYRDRGLNIIFSGNNITDNRTTVSNDDAIFVVSNQTQNPTGYVTFNDNNFSSSKATKFVNVYSTNTSMFTFKMGNSLNQLNNNCKMQIQNNNSTNTHVLFN